ACIRKVKTHVLICRALVNMLSLGCNLCSCTINKGLYLFTCGSDLADHRSAKHARTNIVGWIVYCPRTVRRFGHLQIFGKDRYLPFLLTPVSVIPVLADGVVVLILCSELNLDLFVFRVVHYARTGLVIFN